MPRVLMQAAMSCKRLNANRKLLIISPTMAKTETTSNYPAVGGKAPAFTALASNGETVKLSDFKGKIVVLYFYPKDNTSGCTKEACGFRDSHKKLTNAGAVVL